MKFNTEGERILYGRWNDAQDLRRDFLYMGDEVTGDLRGNFATEGEGNRVFNIYKEGRVVSRPLIQSPTGKNPNVGVILPGAYAFQRKNDSIETLTVLEGELEASVNDGPASRLNRDGAIVAPAGTTLNLTVREGWAPCFYICRFTPIKAQAGATG